MATRRKPDWWATARMLRWAGCTYDEICDHTGRGYDAVRYALNAGLRERMKAARRRRYHEAFKTDPERMARHREDVRAYRQLVRALDSKED